MLRSLFLFSFSKHCAKCYKFTTWDCAPTWRVWFCWRKTGLWQWFQQIKELYHSHVTQIHNYGKWSRLWQNCLKSVKNWWDWLRRTWDVPLLILCLAGARHKDWTIPGWSRSLRETPEKTCTSLPATVHNSAFLVIYKCGPLRRQGCTHLSSEGQTAFTATSAGGGGPKCLFYL